MSLFFALLRTQASVSATVPHTTNLFAPAPRELLVLLFLSPTEVKIIGCYLHTYKDSTCFLILCDCQTFIFVSRIHSCKLRM
jgi:hypothetical protein